MTGSSDSRYRVSYRYGHDGERIGKYSVSSSGGSPTETLYFNKMWTWRYNGLQSDRVGQNSKHIYLGDTRILTKIARADGSFTNEESLKQYYYHSDHLGSAQLITNADGQEYERIEYTPYGELWVEKASALSNIDIPYRFTGKEMDEETGLYYYGARYLDPKTSRWLSADPALDEYIPGAPINDEAKKRNGNLPGVGGVYNTVNLHLYHYAGNNPVKYTDPDGNWLNLAVGLVAGAVIGASVSTISQLVTTGQVDCTKVAIAAGAGAVSGLLASTGVGLAGQIIGNGVISGMQNTAEQLLFKDVKDFDSTELGVAIGVGMVAGLFGGKGASSAHHSSMLNQMGKRISNAIAHKSGDALKSEVRKAFVYYMKNGGKTASVETFKAVMRSSIPNLGKTAYDKILQEITKEPIQ